MRPRRAAPRPSLADAALRGARSEDARSHTQDAKLLAEMRRSAEENLKANIKALQEHVDALLADSDKVALEVWKAMVSARLRARGRGREG